MGINNFTKPEVILIQTNLVEIGMLCNWRTNDYRSKEVASSFTKKVLWKFDLGSENHEMMIFNPSGKKMNYESQRFKRNTNTRVKVIFAQEHFLGAGFNKGEKFNPDGIELEEVTTTNLEVVKKEQYDVYFSPTSKV